MKLEGFWLKDEVWGVRFLASWVLHYLQDQDSDFRSQHSVRKMILTTLSIVLTTTSFMHAAEGFSRLFRVDECRSMGRTGTGIAAARHLAAKAVDFQPMIFRREEEEKSSLDRTGGRNLLFYTEEHPNDQICYDAVYSPDADAPSVMCLPYLSVH